MIPFQGGLPSYTTRSRQRGSGFLSAAKRFLLPVAKRGLKELVGGVGDVISGNKSVGEAFAERGGNLAGAAIDQGKDMLMNKISRKRKTPNKAPPPPPKKNKKVVKKKNKKQQQHAKKRTPRFR